MSAAAAARPIGYLQLLRENRALRRIWFGDVVSLAGDWFTTISLLALLLEYTGKGQAVGLMLIARFVPALIFAPLAGVVADRYWRKAILLVCDLLRAVVVLGFLFVRGPGDVWLVYLLTFVQLSITAFFDPAEQAAVGSVAKRDQVVTANALQSVTWSVMLASGALVGGVFAQAFGREAAFVVNALTYLLSAGFVLSAAIPRQSARPAPATWRAALGVDDLLEGARFLRRERAVRRVIFAKAGWGLAGGGAIMLYSIFGQRIFHAGGSSETSIGILYAARGVGALIGPTVARLWSRDHVMHLDRGIGIAFVVMIAGYALFAGAPWIGLAALALIVAHAGASTVWTFSTSLLNLWVPDRLRGRTFATDLALHTIALVVSIAATGYAMDHLHVPERLLMAGLAAVMLVPALLWAVVPRGVAPAPAVGLVTVPPKSDAEQST